MSDITINYKGNAIATMDASGTKTLLTEGKYLEDDVEVVYVKPSGGTDYLVERLNGTLTSYASDDVTKLTPYSFEGNNITTLSLPNCITLDNNALRSRSTLTSVYFPKVSTIGADALNGCSGLTVLVFPSLSSITTRSFSSCTGVVTFDLGDKYTNGISSNFNSMPITTLILRKTTIQGIQNANTLNSAVWGSGGTGGTIYIPKVLYDHLGDGGSLDYKAASNWSTINGYGTITWAKIEGSYYETHYADGTLIPT